MSEQVLSAEPSTYERVQAFFESPGFQRTILVLIVVNAVTLGLETSPAVMAAAGHLLHALDKAILSIFVCEIVAKMVLYRTRFHRDPWNLFDLFVVGVALVPATGNLSVLRALRVLRVLRLVSMIPAMRQVVQGLLGAIPGMGSVVALLSLVFYVFAVMATKMFGADFPQWFGSLGNSLFSLFQIMTLESWSMGIVRPVMELHPSAWLLFVPFILVTSFVVLNLFIAVIVNTMQTDRADDAEAERQALALELRELRTEIAELKDLIAR